MKYKIIDRAEQNKSVENELNELGKDGWELVSAITIHAGYGDKKIRYIFKKV